MRLRTKHFLVVVAACCSAVTAEAQQPICPQFVRGQQVAVVCRASYGFSVVRFAADFTVDHLLKPLPWSFERSLSQIAQAFAFKELRDNPELAKFLLAIAPIRFAQLDRTTGTVSAAFESNERAYSAPVSGVTGTPKFSLDLPERLEGGYWRAPDVVQIAFWQGKRMHVRLENADGNAIDGEIACVSMTPDGVSITFAQESTPAVFLMTRGCSE
ncbi:MAG TPA: hypothetical protein VN634_12370 [Candidatus Limnocylindrales bacterium]|nr:hypothetical protein [Candidatus Limnocylindrales bacterium]